jgi:murein DD-endopeptidase MepM/ murein hydrolase activator NlpD
MPRDGGEGARAPRWELELRRPWARVLGVVALLAALSTVVMRPGPASADIKSDQTEVAQLGQQINADGQAVQTLVVEYDQAQTHEAAIEAQVTAAQAHLTQDHTNETHDRAVLRAIAIKNYMSGAVDGSLLALFDTSDADSWAGEQEYNRIATQGVSSAIDAVQVDEQHTQAAETALHTAQVAAEASVQQLAGARQAAQAALTRDDTLLSQTKGDLQNLLAIAAKQREEAEQQAEKQEEEALAAAQAASHRPVTVAFNPTPGSYANPLRAINGLNPERVDQGVDYSGFGPIYAVGDGVVLSTANSGWPGGTFISYRLTDGPAAGLAVYAAEDIDPMVSVGQTVTPTTVLGAMYEGPDGIETGWADPSGDGVSMANDAGQFSGANSTAFGANFSELLASLGAPPGVMQNSPPTGALPANWPSW